MQPRRLEDTNKTLSVRIAPFIGLFGTVLGIVVSFQRIDATDSPSLAVVGPAIAEALVGTAAGLAIAIPTAYLYSRLTGR